MCGIVGAVHWERPLPRPRVEAMLGTLVHRGPDDGRVVALEDGYLGARRLAIVDLEHGAQPVCDAGGRVWAALNGEIYGHEALRRQLVARGSTLRSRCDTEVAAALAAEHGARRSLEMLEGMFALALWERRPRRLLLARDRLGQKPLYWTRLRDGTLLFASELKALLAWGDLERDIDRDALAQLLCFEFIPSPRTIYRGIHRLPAGCCLVAGPGELRVEPYWDPPRTGVGRRREAASVAAREVRTAVGAAVRRRLLADVPIAFLLSGGIDSSTVLALAAPACQDRPRTFSVTFREASFDESGPAEAMARHVGARHTTLPFPPSRLPDLLDRIGDHLCEPLADGSLPATWVLAEGVHAAGYKVALSGDGADEHFFGYPTYLAHALAPAFEPVRRPGRALAARLPTSLENLGADTVLLRFFEGLGRPWARRNQVWLGAFLPEEVERWLPGANPWREVDALAARAEACPTTADRAAWLDQRLYLGEGVLQKVDRASMAHALEVRSPFCDHRLAELAATLPRGTGLRPPRTKRVLRRAVADLLPPPLRNRPKKGFGTPLGPWLAGPCTHLLDDLPERLEGLLPPEAIQHVVRAHRDRRADHRRRLWTLLVLGRWLHGPYGPGAG